MEQIPRLSEDVLYIISEKLLFKKFCGLVDLRTTNSCTLFMYHSARNMRALLSHFSKMKELELSTYCNECIICFYNDKLPIFTGPYIVSKNLFSGLIDAGLLRISSVQINKILGKLSKIDFSTTNKNIYKYLVNHEGLIMNMFIRVSPDVSVPESSGVFLVPGTGIQIGSGTGLQIFCLWPSEIFKIFACGAEKKRINLASLPKYKLL
ncbi:unnamed protein product [Meloidogyne enterolobii]|uniref:Uncharacterized protein n=1 Tax=Meloidogyne enterolobii TaxID=390850 RepID=A0ACB0ZS48_MELEN